MATKPQEYPDWAENDVQELKDVNNDGNLVLLDNKTAPTPEYKLSGELFQQPLPYNYVNYQFNLINSWLKYIDQGVVGDYKVMPTAETATTMVDRFGGTWQDIGTDTVAGETIRLFKKLT